MGYATTTYATPEVLDATWTAVPQGATGGAIEIRPYPTAAPRAGGGFAIPAPPPNPLDGFDDYGGRRYLDASGNAQWMPTPDEIARDRRAGLPTAGIDYDRLDGMDGSYAGRPPRPVAPSPAGSIGRAAGSNMDDVIGQLGGRVALGVGGVVAGGIAGFGEYQSGGGVASAVGVGVGAGVGSVAGAVAGGAIGAVGGPIGVAVGGAIGGAVGGAIGGAIGDALIPDANKNGAQVVGTTVVGNSDTNYDFVNRYYQDGNTPGSGINPFTQTDTIRGPLTISIVITYPSFGYQEQWRVTGRNWNTLQPYTRNFPKYWRQSSGFLAWNRATLDITRPDGQTDPAIYNPNTRPKPSIGVPDFKLPGIDLPVFLPGPTGNPGPKPPKWPFGDPNPTGEPTFDPTGYPYPDPNPGPTPTPGPTDDPAPYPTPNPDPTPDPTPDPETCDPCAKLDQVLTLLKPAVTGQIDLSPCPVGEDPPQNILTVAEGAAGISGLSAKLDLALMGVEDLWELLRCQDGAEGGGVPESWFLRRNQPVPQWTVTTKIPYIKSSSRWNFTIPHPKFVDKLAVDNGQVQRFRYTRGETLVTIVLSDNSKAVGWCETPGEGKRWANYVLSLILPSMAANAAVKVTEGANPDIKPQEVEFHSIKHWTSDRELTAPAWRVVIP